MTHALRLLAVGILCCAGCSRGVKDYEPYATSERTLFLQSMRTAAPEPVYSRTRWVQLPEVLPDREPEAGSEAVEPSHSLSLRPVFHLSLKNVSLEEAGRVLAAMARYSSFTAPSIARNKISIENLGTIDELARIMEKKAQVQVVVDHENKEVRLLAPTAEQPELYPEQAS